MSSYQPAPPDPQFIEEAKKLWNDGLRVYAMLNRQHEVIKVFGSYSVDPDLCIDQFVVHSDGAIERASLRSFYEENNCYQISGHAAGLFPDSIPSA